MEILEKCWNREIISNPIWIIQQKIKKLATTLSTWSRNELGDICAKVKDFEERSRVAEEDLICNNTEDYRRKLHAFNADYIRFL